MSVPTGEEIDREHDELINGLTEDIEWIKEFMQGEIYQSIVAKAAKEEQEQRGQAYDREVKTA